MAKYQTKPEEFEAIEFLGPDSFQEMITSFGDSFLSYVSMVNDGTLLVKHFDGHTGYAFLGEYIAKYSDDSYSVADEGFIKEECVMIDDSSLVRND